MLRISEDRYGRAARLTALVLVVASLLLSQGSQAQSPEEKFRVIVNELNPVSSLTSAELAELFLKVIGSWDNGEQVFPVDQGADTPVRESFSRVVFGRSAAAVTYYWQRKLFSGRDVPPLLLGSDEAVLEYVKQHQGAVGYVSPDAPASGVKIIEVR